MFEDFRSHKIGTCAYVEMDGSDELVVGLSSRVCEGYVCINDTVELNLAGGGFGRRQEIEGGVRDHSNLFGVF